MGSLQRSGCRSRAKAFFMEWRNDVVRRALRASGFCRWRSELRLARVRDPPREARAPGPPGNDDGCVERGRCTNLEVLMASTGLRSQPPSASLKTRENFYCAIKYAAKCRIRIQNNSGRLQGPRGWAS